MENNIALKKVKWIPWKNWDYWMHEMVKNILNGKWSLELTSKYPIKNYNSLKPPTESQYGRGIKVSVVAKKCMADILNNALIIIFSIKLLIKPEKLEKMKCI